MPSSVQQDSRSPRSWTTRWHHLFLVAAVLVLLSLLCANPARAQETPPDLSEDVLARGRALFHGSANCQECHGQGGVGTEVGPDLTDEVWLHGAGSYAMIVDRVTHGVTRRESTNDTAMPMRGWSPLSDDQLFAVATYVWSLSRPLPPAPATPVEQ